MLFELGREECERVDRAIEAALARCRGGRRKKLSAIARLLRAESRKSPLAASFMPSAWPCHAHRTLAEIPFDVARGR